MASSATALYASNGAESPARSAIRRLSLPFEWLFTLLLGVTLAAGAFIGFFAAAPGYGAIWLEPSNTWLVLGANAPPPNAIQFNALPAATQLAGAGAFALMVGSLACVFFCLRNLFACYRVGDVFGAAPQAWMQRAGASCIAFALAPLLRAVGSPDRAWFHAHSVAILIMGAGLFVFARVVALGQEVERETKEFV
jgi:hypothetical protein